MTERVQVGVRARRLAFLLIAICGAAIATPARADSSAERVAGAVPGVRQVVNTLRTSTGDWSEEEKRINDRLSLNGFSGLQAKVIGKQVFLSGQVTNEAEEQRALRVVSSDSRLQPVNFMRVVPGSIV